MLQEQSARSVVLWVQVQCSCSFLPLPLTCRGQSLSSVSPQSAAESPHSSVRQPVIPESDSELSSFISHHHPRHTLDPRLLRHLAPFLLLCALPQSSPPLLGAPFPQDAAQTCLLGEASLRSLQSESHLPLCSGASPALQLLCSLGGRSPSCFPPQLPLQANLLADRQCLIAE